jgi:hypothetical protein
MSSFATAPSRTPDQDPQNGEQQLHLLVDPEEEAPALDAPRVEPTVTNGSQISSQSLDEVTRVERLLSQLEARSLALVPYNYGTLREVHPRKTNSGLIAGTLVAIWLSTMILGVAYIRYMHIGTGRAAATAPLIIPPPDADPQDQKVASSVDHLAKALVSSSERMNELQASMERSNRDLQRIATKVNNSGQTKAVPGAAQNDAEDAAPSGTAADAKLPNNWHRVLELKPTDAATPHKAADGSIDYWLVPNSSGAAPSKVLPIGTSPDGVVVHNLEDGKDYTLTPSGEWRNGTLPPAGN